jgi:hypothetical protein
MGKTNEMATRAEQVELTSPSQIMDFATSLKQMIVENKLFTNIKGKNYVNVDGWQIAGAFTGTFPVVEKVEELPEKRGAYKYRAEVSLRDKEGKMVGYGVAICSNREAGKKNFDEYAVASMAQTRAVGKAYRMKIGWLLKVAGYETTPAEEMDAVREAQVVQKEEKQFSVRDVSYAITRLEQAKDMAELKVAFGTLGDVMNHPDVMAKKDELKQKFAQQSEVVTATRGGDDGVDR